MTTDKPIATIATQTLTTTPVVSDATLVDDTVALVDDATALVGGTASIYTGMMLTAENKPPRPTIKRRR